ncbi:putative serine protease K12H4.7 [Aricia agestis]|uniref:putative serine protease K12H4.7 n=1 Tax=Aricia agestis TaxID=91739 RepID=UPI001C2055F8|nr:putative serine protease K12H4.7 [Aricia agestis]
MNRFIVFVFLLFIAIPIAESVRYFKIGRSRGGNLGAPAGDVPDDLPPALWFIQKLDHFTPTDKRIWKQRYFVNDQFYDYNNPGPVFLMIGGEGPADAKWMVKGAWIEYAKFFNALCIQLEHRYYGASHPTPDVSVKNLQYLSSNQALADLANFINAVNEKYKFNREVKWFAFGGSYPGSLAAWLRMKYPHLVFASISSSGPLRAVVNFMEYYEVVVDALHQKTGSDDCVNMVKQAHKEIENLILTNPAELEKEFKLCKPFTQASKDDIKNFFNSIADDFADIVQYNEDNRMSADPKYRNLTINTVCDILTEPGDKMAYKKLAAFNSIILDKTNQTCMDYDYKNMIQELRMEKWGPAQEGGRQWMYQTCTEFGFYQTSSGETEVFGNHFDVDFFIQQCQDIFGKKFNQEFVNKAADWTNNFYGGLNIPAERIVYVHGSVDPWHALGITTTKNNNAPAIFIPGTAHCANMYPSSERDSAALVEARVEIQQYISSWIDLP